MLTGKFLLGSQFIQDTDTDWIKINGVVMGESYKFSHKISWSRNIKKLLESLSNDTTVVCVLYEWKSGYAYIKTGFDLNDKTDYARNPEFTTFINKRAINLISI